MNIAINLVGLSHHDVGNGIHSYKDAYLNLFKNLIEPLKKSHNVSIHLHTYNNSEIENIKKIYNTNDITLLDLPEAGDKNNARLASNTYIDSLKYFQYKTNSDFIISTRFDLDIDVPINFDFTKFNFLFKELNNWDNNELTTDTLYAFPIHMLDDVIESLYDVQENRDGRFCPGLFHCLYPYLKKRTDDIVFIDDEHSTVQISNKFRLGRYKIKK
tara:strand:- start:6108 stop:6752 length:645 start_codon:yes stop_codon:yes gene_type:complete